MQNTPNNSRNLSWKRREMSSEVAMAVSRGNKVVVVIVAAVGLCECAQMVPNQLAGEHSSRYSSVDLLQV